MCNILPSIFVARSGIIFDETNSLANEAHLALGETDRDVGSAGVFVL